MFNYILLGAVVLILSRWAYMSFSHTYRMRQALRGLEEAMNGRRHVEVRTVRERHPLVQDVPSEERQPERLYRVL